MALGIRPEPRVPFVDLRTKTARINARKPRLGDRTGIRPTDVHVTRVVEKRVVEVDEDGLGEGGHVSILAEAWALAQHYTGNVMTVTITASFPDADSARAAIHDLAAEGIDASIVGRREGAFMGRFAVIVAAWSIAGTAAGAAIGAALSFTVGPHGTEGLILLVVTWALFAHLLIGLLAGYALLSDRSEREFSPGVEATLTAQADKAAAAEIAERLRTSGATRVSGNGETTTELASEQ
jgi:hypothetical protein